MPDLLLVERSRARETRAFETLMRRYNRRLFRIARSVLGTADAAEEAVRATYLRAFANLDRYEPAGKFGAWLARMAFNEAFGARRHQPVGLSAGERPAHSSAGGIATRTGFATATAPVGLEGSPQIAAGGDHNSLELAVDALPEVFRTVLVLRVLEELSGVEVAVCLGLNETTVRTRLYRAQQRLNMEVARRLRLDAPHIYELTAERSDHIITQVLARLSAPTPVAEPR